MGYSDEQIKSVIKDLSITGPRSFSLMFKDKDLIMYALKDVLSTRRDLRRAVRADIKASGIVVLDGSVVNEDDGIDKSIKSIEAKKGKFYYMGKMYDRNDSGDWVPVAKAVSPVGGKD